MQLLKIGLAGLLSLFLTGCYTVSSKINTFSDERLFAIDPDQLCQALLDREANFQSIDRLETIANKRGITKNKCILYATQQYGLNSICRNYNYAVSQGHNVSIRLGYSALASRVASGFREYAIPCRAISYRQEESITTSVFKSAEKAIQSTTNHNKPLYQSTNPYIKPIVKCKQDGRGGYNCSEK